MNSLIVKKINEIDELKSYILKNITNKKIHQKVIESLFNRYGHSFELFMRDIDGYVTIEDLKTITSINKNNYFPSDNYTA